MNSTTNSSAANVSHVLVVEDDENLRVALADNLETEGYEVSVAENGAAAERRLAERPCDLIVLDLMLPDTDGYTLCRRWREQGESARILMLTARSLEEDIVRGFDAAADDYIAKPYKLALLLARVRALLRRGNLPQAATIEHIRFDRFTLDVTKRLLTDDAGELIELTPKGFELLQYFLHHRDRALSRRQILDDVWGHDIVVDERTVDNFVSSLKKKLGWNSQSAFKFVTVRGVGYRLEL